ncbi:nuclear transport factor 2 family protein [Algoriphagus namhaensis]|uniref:Nuclear transport factor 2 family protein n=1 Tax=Algoriphagus namhaensis TaxID=915353 RepID=A0ABV8AQ03_9BACT
MKHFFSLALALLCFSAFGQSSEISQIKTQREASNEALKARDDARYLDFLTEDVLITTGAGTLISGKANLDSYVKKASGPAMYWIRTPDEILVNPETQLAWETGTWKGYYFDQKDPIVQGNYSAQWTKKSGTWLIQAQLFVTLPQSTQ